MRICIPVKEENGLQSRVAKKIKSAKAFAIIDLSPSGKISDIQFIPNNMEHDEIIPYLASHDIDLFIVGEISKDDEEMILSMGIDIVKEAFGRVESVLKRLMGKD